LNWFKCYHYLVKTYDLRSIFNSDIAIVTKAFELHFERYKNTKRCLENCDKYFSNFKLKGKNNYFHVIIQEVIEIFSILEIDLKPQRMHSQDLWLNKTISISDKILLHQWKWHWYCLLLETCTAKFCKKFSHIWFNSVSIFWYFCFIII